LRGAVRNRVPSAFSTPWDLARSPCRDDVTKSGSGALSGDVAGAARSPFSRPWDFVRAFDTRAQAEPLAKLAFGRRAVELLKLAPSGSVIGTEQRLVVGVVLEPTADPRVGADLQGDVYPSPEVAGAERSWRENGETIFRQHEHNITSSVEIVQSWITPCDVVISGQRVVAGSWLLAVRILDDELWAAAKDGTVTGFSVGGSARRVPLKQT